MSGTVSDPQDRSRPICGTPSPATVGPGATRPAVRATTQRRNPWHFGNDRCEIRRSPCPATVPAVHCRAMTGPAVACATCARRSARARRRARGRRRRPRHRRRRVPHAARAERLGQDHGPADDRRLRAARPRDPWSSTGVDVTRTAPFERNVNTVFQDYALFPHMTVLQNVEYGLKVKGVAKAERRQQADEALESVRLADYGIAQARPAVRRPAPAGRAGPGPGQPPQGAAARRAARRPRPQAARGDAGRAQGHPAPGRDHLRLRDPRPGGSAHDVRPDRGVQRRPDRAGRQPGRGLRAAGHPVRRRLRRARRTCSQGAAAQTSWARTAIFSVRPEKIRLVAADVAADADDPRATARWARCARWSTSGSATRFVVDLDAGGTLVVLQQNLPTSSMDVASSARPGCGWSGTGTRVPRGGRHAECSARSHQQRCSGTTDG